MNCECLYCGSEFTSIGNEVSFCTPGCMEEHLLWLENYFDDNDEETLMNRKNGFPY